MNITCIIPHYQSKITAYTISQLLKFKGKHNLDIIVVDNNEGDGSYECIKPFETEILYLPYPKDKIQSHGVAFDFAMPHVRTDWFITMESDSFPTKDNWLDYYEKLINEGWDAAGSLLHLSGGQYVHPACALYKKTIWQEAKRYLNGVEYIYLPNYFTREGFDCHTMLHKSVVEDVFKSPYDYLELAEGYKGLNRLEVIDRMMYYSPIVAPFHCGLGRNNESVKTYGQRTVETEVPNVLLDNKYKIIRRIGNEPAQWFTYFMLATGKKIYYVPTEIKWLPNRENQQQEYTLMQNGCKHIWAGSAFLGMAGGDMNDVYEFKKNQIEQLYNSLPNNQK
jgi:glycosyltransferase involved in cell wall biosynthesis